MKNNITAWVLILFFFFAVPLCHGAMTLADADSAYSRGDYQAAVDAYVDVMESQGYSAPLLFNLGNAAFKAGDWGLARLSYERARRLDPSSEAINNNLDYLASKIEDANKAELKGRKYKVTPDEMSFFQSLHKTVAQDRTSDYWAVFSAMAFVLFICFAALYIFSRNVLARKVGFFAGMIFAGFSVVFIIFAFSAARAAASSDRGVVMAFKVDLLTEPSEGSGPVATPLTRGTRMDVVSEEVDAEDSVSWYKVRLNSDFVGWIPASDFRVIGNP